MSKYSNKIIKFLNNNTIHKVEFDTEDIIKQLQNIKHTVSDIKLLEECVLEQLHSIDVNPTAYQLSGFTLDIKQYAKLYNSKKGIKIPVPVYTDKCRNILKDIMFNNTFMSLDIHQEIETTKLTHKKYIIDNKHVIDIFYKVSLDCPDINKISLIINIVSQLLKKDKKVNLIVFFGNQKKLIDTNTTVLTCENVNSGATYIDKLIIIWRKEEFYKVLIHELLHYYEYYKEIECNLPNVSGNDLTNEAYVEKLATIINCYLENGDLHIEISFMLFQIAKIIYIFGGKTFDDYLSNKIIIKQTTNARSYYILKTQLFIDIHKYIETINKYITLLHLTKDKKWIHKTMRMTVY